MRIFSKYLKDREVWNPLREKTSVARNVNILSTLTDLAQKRLVVAEPSWSAHLRPPTCIRSDDGGEFTATAVREWLDRLDVTTLYIEPGSPWQNGTAELWVGTVRRELLDHVIVFNDPSGWSSPPSCLAGGGVVAAVKQRGTRTGVAGRVPRTHTPATLSLRKNGLSPTDPLPLR
jgi:transposase InsO family protein